MMDAPFPTLARSGSELMSPSRILLAVPFCLVAAAAPAQDARLDAEGVPLPTFAVLRLGSARLRHADRINDVAVAPDGSVIVTGSHDHTVRFWDPATGRQVARFQGAAGNYVACVTFSADGKRWAAEMGGPNVVVFDTATGKGLLNAHTYCTDHLALSPDGKTLYTSDRDNTVCARDVETGKELYRLRGEKWLGPAAVSPDGKLLATGGGGKRVVLYEAATGKELRALEGHEATVVALRFSPDGKFLASSGGAFDKGTHLWDVEKGQSVRRFNDCTLPVFSPDGKRLLLVDGRPSRSSLWELDGKEPLLHFGDYTLAYKAAAFLPDGKTVVTVDHSSEVRLWDTKTGQEKLTRSSPRGAVAGVAWS